MDYNTNSARQSLTRPDAFGDPLKNDINFILLSAETFQYNCIAFALGMEDRWVDPEEIPWHWWPPVPKGESVDHLKEAFKYFGFEDCGSNDSVEELYDKIAIYELNNCWTHAAKVISSEVYHSKFGASYDGRHSGGNVLQLRYGNVCAFMKRLKSKAHLTDDRKGLPPGEIHLTVPLPINGMQVHLVTYKSKTYLAETGQELILKDGKVSLGS